MATARLRLFWVLAAAVVTGVLIHQYLTSIQQSENVVVVRAAVAARAVIAPDMVEVRPMIRRDRQRFFADAFREPGQVVAMAARRDLAAGEILRPTDLVAAPTPGTSPSVAMAAGVAAAGGDADASHFISPGLRAITATIDIQGAVGQHLRRGQRVDVVFTPKSREVTIPPGLLMRAVEVFDVQASAGKMLTGGSGDALNVTLLVTPEQAVLANLAKRQGYIDLALTPLQDGGMQRDT